MKSVRIARSLATLVTRPTQRIDDPVKVESNGEHDVGGIDVY